MSKISLIAKLTAADGKTADLQAALDTLITAADEEDGLEIYSVHQDTDDGNVFYFFELYRDQAAFEVHGKGEAMGSAMKALGSLLASRPDVTVLSPVAAKGMEL